MFKEQLTTVALLRIVHLLGTPCQQLSQRRLKQRRGRGLHCLENHRFQTLHQQSCLGDRERGHKIIGILIPYGSSMVLGILGIIINSMSIDFFHLGMLLMKHKIGYGTGSNKRSVIIWFYPSGMVLCEDQPDVWASPANCSECGFSITLS